MADETVIKIETPESGEKNETVIENPIAPIVEPMVDTAAKLAEACVKIELIEATLSAAIAENEILKSNMELNREELTRLRTLIETPPEPEPVVDDTPADELPVETLTEVEIIPEQIPEVIEEVKKRKRFFV